MNLSPKFTSKIFIITAVFLGVAFAVPVMAQTDAPSVSGELKERAKTLRQNVTTQIKTENARLELKNKISKFDVPEGQNFIKNLPS